MKRRTEKMNADGRLGNSGEGAEFAIKKRSSRHFALERKDGDAFHNRYASVEEHDARSDAKDGKSTAGRTKKAGAFKSKSRFKRRK